MNTDKIYAESIAKEYAVKENSKVTALKKLDAKAKKPALIFTYTFGIVSCLMAGLGMSLAMQVLAEGIEWFILGIVLGLLGFTGCAVNYPIYRKILKNSKAKYAYEIVQLAKEISEQ